MSGGPLVVIGDTLLDRDVDGTVERLSPDAPVPVLDETRATARPGGAGLAALLAARDGHAVTLVTALAADAAGALLRELLETHGVEVVDLGLYGPTPEKVRLRTGARSLLRIDRGGSVPARVGRISAAARAAIGWAPAILVADYGRGVAAESELSAALAERAAAATPIVWDPHPRGSAPVPGVTLATPNDREAAAFAPDVNGGDGVRAVAARAAALRSAWHVHHVCVTRGADGALLHGVDGAPLAIPAPPIERGDPCGAGDRFAARAAVRLATGASVTDAVLDAVAAASRFVAEGGAASVSVAPRAGESAWTAAGGGDPAHAPVRSSMPWGPSGDGLVHALETIAATRERGGTIVAAGGCFDLLHAGHLHTLEAARALGDCLVVCVNADVSVRRLKGPSRPVVMEGDRAALLAGLRCVDAVVTFDEDTPERLLGQLRPDVWAKGGDYAGRTLPEAAALAAWGGRAVVLSHHTGLSTTQLIEEAASDVAHRA